MHEGQHILPQPGQPSLACEPHERSTKHIYLGCSGWARSSYLAQVGERLLAQAVRVAHVGEDDLLSCLNALRSRQVDLATDSVLAFLHAFGDRVVRENLPPASCMTASVVEWGKRERTAVLA